MARKTVRRTARKTAQRDVRVRTRMVTPYLAVHDAAHAMEWYKKAFGARELNRQLTPEGKVMHGALKIGDSVILLSDDFGGGDTKEPRALGGTSVNLHVHSKDNERLWRRAVENGARVTMPLAVQFWGDRYGKLVDPFGHSWAFGYPAKIGKAEQARLRDEAMAAFSASS
jgi:PhnB protein